MRKNKKKTKKKQIKKERINKLDFSIIKIKTSKINFGVFLFISIYRKSIIMNSYNITFPFRDDNDTRNFLETNIVSKDAYSSNLLLLLLTQKGERYYESDYGTNLLKYIFEPNDDLTSADVEEEIRNTVALYIPEIKITSINFNTDNDDNGDSIPETQLNVIVKFMYNEGSLTEKGELSINF